MKQFLKALLKVIIYFLSVILIIILITIPIRIFIGDLDAIESRFEILFIGTLFLISVIVITIAMSWIGKSRLVQSGWPDSKVGVRWFGIGCLIGLVTGGGMLLLILAFGGGRIVINDESILQYLCYISPLIIFLLIAALSEEWLFRGYPLTVLSPAIGRGWANLIVALFFMAGHWGGNGWNSLTIINIFFFSLLNGVLRFSPGGIPAAWGFHFTWNTIQILVGATLTGAKFTVPMIQFINKGPLWLSGGIYGLEGSIGATISIIIGLLITRKYLLNKEKPIKHD